MHCQNGLVVRVLPAPSLGGGASESSPEMERI
jgi:hypothetical protein